MRDREIRRVLASTRGFLQDVAGSHENSLRLSRKFPLRNVSPEVPWDFPRTLPPEISRAPWRTREGSLITPIYRTREIWRTPVSTREFFRAPASSREMLQALVKTRLGSSYLRGMFRLKSHGTFRESSHSTSRLGLGDPGEPFDNADLPNPRNLTDAGERP